MDFGRVVVDAGEFYLVVCRRDLEEGPHRCSLHEFLPFQGRGRAIKITRQGTAVQFAKMLRVEEDVCRLAIGQDNINAHGRYKFKLYARIMADE